MGLNFLHMLCVLLLPLTNSTLAMEYSEREYLEEVAAYRAEIEKKKRDEEYEQALPRNNQIREALRLIVRTNGPLSEPIKIEGAGVPLEEAALLVCIMHRKNEEFASEDLENFKRLLNLKNHPGPLAIGESCAALKILLEKGIMSRAQTQAIYYMLQQGCIDPNEDLLGHDANSKVPVPSPLLSVIKRSLGVIPSIWLDDVVRMFVICGASPETKIKDPGLKLEDLPYKNDAEMMSLRDCSIMDIVTACSRTDEINIIKRAQLKRQELIEQGWNGKLPVSEQFIKEVFGMEYARNAVDYKELLTINYHHHHKYELPSTWTQPQQAQQDLIPLNRVRDYPHIASFDETKPI